MKAIICGAGIAGLTMAWWLRRDGWDVTLLEKTEKLRGEGYMIDFFGSGWDVAERMGLVPQLQELRYPVQEVCWMDRRARTRAVLDVRLIGNILRGKYVTIARGDLERMLFDALPKTIEMKFGTSIDAISVGESGVEVRLTSGSIANADILVGADGIHSQVREKIFGPEARFFRFLGYHTAAFVFDDPEGANALGNEFKLMTVRVERWGFIRCAAAGLRPFLSIAPGARRFRATLSRN